jgi:uncharacterized membrane protein
MNINDEKNEIKKEFQLERLIFFSDAVFAIIITIMILDVKLPEALVKPSEEESKQAFLQIVPKFIAYATSFMIIGNFWMRHLKIFSFLKDYNKELITLNLFFLFSVSLFPFALSFAFSSSNVMQYTWGLYTYIGIIYFTFVTQGFLMAYLVRNREELCLRPDEIDVAFRWKIRRLSFFAIPVLFLLMLAAGYFHISIYFVLSSILIYGFIIGRLKKKLYPGAKDDDVTLFSFFRKPKSLKHPAKKPHE